MSIKSKLIVNIVVTTAIIVGIFLASFSSLRFLQEKLVYIAEKSAPRQMGTVEFQRELQSYITYLIKVNSAQTMPEYASLRKEAENSLNTLKTSQQTLEQLHAGKRTTLSDELKQIADELFATAEARINGDSAAHSAHAGISQRMKESAALLKKLELHIRSLQISSAASFARSMESNKRISANLRTLEELHKQVKDLLVVLGTALNARSTTEFLIAKGKARSSMGRIVANTSDTFIVADLKALSVDVEEFLNLQADALAQKDAYAKELAFESFKEMNEKLNRLRLALIQENELAATHLELETAQQGEQFRQSTRANEMLLANSELMTLGLTVTGETSRLFSAASIEELQKLAHEIQLIFNRINEQVQGMEIALTMLHARDELNMLRASALSLTTIRNQIFSDNGIVITLKHKFSAIEQSNRTADRLRDLVRQQTIQGKESIALTQDEQMQSLAAVSTTVKLSLAQIMGIGSVAVLIAIFSGFWIYRTILLPLRVVLDAVQAQQEQGKELATLAENVAGGDLNQVIIPREAVQIDGTEIKKDEMGTVLKAIIAMDEAQATLCGAFARMTASLRRSRDEDARRHRVQSGLHELDKILREEQGVNELADRALTYIIGFLEASIGILYRYNDTDEMLQPLATYAVSDSERINKGFSLGQGLVGQVALERRILCLTPTPPGYLTISSALGAADPLNIFILPMMHGNILAGVLELGSFKRINDDDLDFLIQSLEALAIVLNISRSRQLVNDLLERTQTQAEELRAQQEELQQTNEELLERAQMLAEQRKHVTTDQHRT